MSYYHAKRTAIAKAYLAERDATDRVKYPDGRLEHWRAWLQDYMAQPRKTRVDWRPRYAFAPPKDHDYGTEEIIEGEFTELADIAPTSEHGADLGASGGANQGSEPAAPRQAGEDESGGEGWAEEAYPQGQTEPKAGSGYEPASEPERSGRPRGPNSRLEPAADA